MRQPKSAHENANSDCCHTKLNKHGENSAHIAKWNLQFSKFIISDICKNGARKKLPTKIGSFLAFA
jgi:hypothetical protein